MDENRRTKTGWTKNGSTILRIGVAHPHSSDHHPIIGKFFQMNLPDLPHRIFTNLKKEDCDSYTREKEENFALLGLPSSCSTGELLFRKTINTSAKHHIAQGHIPNTLPNLTEITKRINIERDALRFSSPSDPHRQELNA